jgi:hypothetical protein
LREFRAVTVIVNGCPGTALAGIPLLAKRAAGVTVRDVVAAARAPPVARSAANATMKLATPCDAGANLA